MNPTEVAPLKLNVPGSKSMTQRALVIGALCHGPVTIEGALRCDDSERLGELLVRLGVRIDWAGETVTVQGGPLCSDGQPIHCGDGGTVIRFGACLALLMADELVLDGSMRLRERPFAPLAAALNRLGVDVRFRKGNGCPPVALQRARPTPSVVTVDASLSSQFASGLLLAAPRLECGLTLILSGELVSAPYLAMTEAMMARAGARIGRDAEGAIRVEPGGYGLEGGGCIGVEADWSAAALMMAAADLAGIPVDIERLAAPSESLQGDAAFHAMREELRQPRPHQFDLTAAPDLLPPLAVAALSARHPSRIGGAAHARLKECDRVAVLYAGLRQAGARVEEHGDGLTVTPLAVGEGTPGQILATAGDHRMAMAFGALSLRIPCLQVDDPGCVSKSFPGFWTVLETIRRERDSRNR